MLPSSLFYRITLILISLLFNTVMAQKNINLDWIDPSVDPGLDFYAFANGGWQKRNPIPPEYAQWGLFNLLDKKNIDRIHQLLMEASQNKKIQKDSIQQKLADFYWSGMDETKLNQLGMKPLRAQWNAILSIQNRHDLQMCIAYLQSIGVEAVFNFGEMQDLKNSRQIIGVAAQGGLGLPDRDYYLKKDKKTKKLRQDYKHFITELFLLAEMDKKLASEAAETVLSIETTLAKASLSRIKMRNPYAIYHIYDLDSLQQTVPNFLWPLYFEALGVTGLKSINLATPAFFKSFNELLLSLPLSDWKLYLQAHLLMAFAPYLSESFVNLNFEMSSKLTGAKKLLPRWERVTRTANDSLGFAIGELYVKKFFPSSSKAQVESIATRIQKILKEDLSHLNWMTPDTRKMALAKLDKMEIRIGAPEKNWDYSNLKIDRGPYVSNIIKVNEFLMRRELNKIGKPVDRQEWSMPPQAINAYYDPSLNTITILAGILEPPFFDSQASLAMNYGAIGFVIGHEMTHGFDDQGAKFDAEGNLKNWWTQEDLKHFKAATQCIVDQFSRYKVEDLNLQGPLIVGEATADLGGLILAYRAYSQDPKRSEEKNLSHFTPDQQFFLAAAQIWANNIRPEALRNTVLLDPHPPARYRVNGTVANMPAFQQAYNLPDNSPMLYRPHCVIW